MTNALEQPCPLCAGKLDMDLRMRVASGEDEFRPVLFCKSCPFENWGWREGNEVVFLVREAAPEYEPGQD